jgi:hypothetical protein
MGHADLVCKNLLELAKGQEGKHKYPAKNELPTIISLGGKLGGAALGAPKFLGAYAFLAPVCSRSAAVVRPAISPPSAPRAPVPRRAHTSRRFAIARHDEQSI